MLFGEEDEPHARFLCLTDCKANCVVEVRGLDQWIKTEMESQRVGLPRCPRCKTPIMTTPRYGRFLATARADIELAKKQVEEQHKRLLAQSTEVFVQACARKEKLKTNESGESYKLHARLLERICHQFSPTHRQNRDATHISTALNQMRVMEAGQATVSELETICSGTRPVFDSSDKEYVIELKRRLIECLGSEALIKQKDVPEATMGGNLLRVNIAQLFVIANHLLTDKWSPGENDQQLVKGVVEALRFSQTVQMETRLCDEALAEYGSLLEKYWENGGYPPSWAYVMSLAHDKVQDAKRKTAQAEKERQEARKKIQRAELLETLRAASHLSKPCTDSNPCLLMVLLPDGKRLKRSWPAKAPLASLFACIDLHILESKPTTAKIPNYILQSKLVGICFGRPNPTDSKTLEACGIRDMTCLRLVDTDEDNAAEAGGDASHDLPAVSGTVTAATATKLQNQLEKSDALFKILAKARAQQKAKKNRDLKLFRAEIVRAMRLSRGHWYKCKCGFVYCIADCGGAEETSLCPECKGAIGGRNHRLAEGNTTAPEMVADSSTRDYQWVGEDGR